MPKWAVRVAIWGPLLIAGLLAGAYVYMHGTFARDGTELLQVPLSEEEPELDRVGDLRYLGGLDIPRMGQNVGGLSGLRWDAESGRLLAITDDARWVWFDLEEKGDQLTGLSVAETGNLLGVEGEVLTGKDRGDSESLVRDDEGTWGISFERDHRILAYPNDLTARPGRTLFDPVAEFGRLEENGGIEAFAIANGRQLLCAERQNGVGQANCLTFETEEEGFVPFRAEPPSDLIALGSVPTDADALADGTFLVLFRSYSPSDGNSAAVVAYHPDGSRRELMTLRPPLTLDNFEGLAVREEGGRTFLYIVSDDNFSGSQRTLLMKFEVQGEPG